MPAAGRRGLAVALATALAVASWPLGHGPAAAGGRELALRFDGSRTSLDLRSSGRASLDVSVSAAGGEVTVARGRGGKGYAARMPTFGSDPAVLVVRPRSGDPLSPRRRGFVFGAHFDVDAASQGSSTDNGDNLVQRGLFSGPQYKIQVDHGRVSCRVAGAAGAVMVRSRATVDPRWWHRVRCIREGSKVTLELVRYRAGSRTVRRWSGRGAIGALRFDPATALSVGGKVDSRGRVVARDSDQFNGRVDNVFFRLR